MSKYKYEDIVHKVDPDKQQWIQSKEDVSGGNGKGSSPRNVSGRFKDNFDKIDWSNNES